MTEEDTANEAIFSKVWEQIEPLIKSLPLVAHNKGFDEACLKAVSRTYRMDYPDYQFYCTLQESRRQLTFTPIINCILLPKIAVISNQSCSG